MNSVNNSSLNNICMHIKYIIHYLLLIFAANCFLVYIKTGDYTDLDAANMTTSGNYSGLYRSYRGVDVPTPCPAGSYCPQSTKHSMEYLCPEGTYSNQTELWLESQCTPCEPGTYCAGEGIESRTLI